MNIIDINWSIICSDKIIIEAKKLIKKSEEIRNIIINETNNKKIIELLADDAYEFNTFNKLCSVLSIIIPNEIKEVDKLMNTYMVINKFYND